MAGLIERLRARLHGASGPQEPATPHVRPVGPDERETGGEAGFLADQRTFVDGERILLHVLEDDGGGIRYGRIVRACSREPARFHVEYENKIPRFVFCLPEEILIKIEGES